jgi:hypothetical protein
MRYLELIIKSNTQAMTRSNWTKFCSETGLEHEQFVNLQEKFCSACGASKLSSAQAGSDPEKYQDIKDILFHSIETSY